MPINWYCKEKVSFDNSLSELKGLKMSICNKIIINKKVYCCLSHDVVAWDLDFYFIFFIYLFFYHKIQVILKKQGDHTKANTSGEEAQKETMGLIDIGLPQSKK